MRSSFSPATSRGGEKCCDDEILVSIDVPGGVGQHGGGRVYPIGGSDSPVTRRPGPAIVGAMLALVEAVRAKASLVVENIAAELAKLGHDASKDTVAKYMPKRSGTPGRPPSTTWGTFLRTSRAADRRGGRSRRQRGPSDS